MAEVEEAVGVEEEGRLDWPLSAEVGGQAVRAVGGQSSALVGLVVVA